MADTVDKATRSRMMSGIKGKNTKPEMIIRQGLHREGFRFRIHAHGLPGKPDLVLSRWRAAIFIHGCFWHRHEGCRFTTTPATRPAFWNEKFAANVLRDERNQAALSAADWRVATVWECAVRRDPRGSIDQIARWIRSSAPSISVE